MIVKNGLILMSLLVFLSCQKQVLDITISPDKDVVHPGDTINVSVLAQSGSAITYLWATIEVFCAIDNFPYEERYLGAGTLLEISKKSHKLQGDFSYVVPTSVYGSEYGPYDFLKIWVFCEQGSKQVKKALKVDINI
jgi:hypothetical protein